MPPDRVDETRVSYNPSADPRRRKPESAPEQAPQASTSKVPTPAAPSSRSLSSKQIPGPYGRSTGLIKCQGACGKELPKNRFSEQQHRNQRKHPFGGKAMMCEDCAPPQQETIKCAECEKIKLATSFSYRQRKSASRAVCSSCQAGIDRANAVKRKKGGKSYDDDEEDDEDSEEEERQREEALKKGNPYELAEEDEDPWELYR